MLHRDITGCEQHDVTKNKPRIISDSVYAGRSAATHIKSPGETDALFYYRCTPEAHTCFQYDEEMDPNITDKKKKSKTTCHCIM